MIPIYIDEPIDILSDSVLEICEKAAYKAHNGTYVEGLWDAAPSSLVSRVPFDTDWQPMRINFYADDIKQSYDPEVSSVPEFCRISGKNEFFGYESEPPVAPAFREVAPVGIATNALKALGTMQALLEADGKSDEIPSLNEYFCKIWGADPSVIANTSFFKPELNTRSRTDLMKSLRGTSHRLYGYENEQNYVGVEGGGYTKSTMLDNRYIDWHRIFLVLRFIGVSMLMSDELGQQRLWNQSMYLPYGLVEREFPLVTNSPHCPSFAHLPQTVPTTLVTDSMLYSIAYYSSRKITELIANREMYVEQRARLDPDLEVSDFTLATVRAALTKPRSAIRLDFKTQAAQPYDIIRSDGSKTSTSLLGKMSKLDIHHQLSPLRAMELALTTRMASNWGKKGDSRVRMTLDMLAHAADEESTEKLTIVNQVLDIAGANFGSLSWKILKKFRRDPDEALIEYLAFVYGGSDIPELYEMRQLDILIPVALRSPKLFNTVRTLFKRAHRTLVHLYNVPRVPERALSAGLTTGSSFQAILANLWSMKKTYWIGHYSMRSAMFSKSLDDAKSLDATEYAAIRSKLVRYQWLLRWLPKYACRVTADLDVWPEIDEENARLLLLDTVKNFTRKRKLALKTEHRDLPHKAIADLLDNIYKPKVPFRSLVEEVHRTAKLMSSDIAYVLRKVLMEPDIEPTRDPFEEAFRKLAEEDDKEFTQQEGWASFGNSDEHDSLDQVVSEPINLVVPTAVPTSEEIELAAEFASMKSAGAGLARYAKPKRTIKLSSMKTFAAINTRRRNPYAELLDLKRATPDLVAWATRAECTIEELRDCPQGKYHNIIEIGKVMLAMETENPTMEEHDIQ